MWPWEHAALGYLLYSLALRATGREPPSDTGAFVLLFGTLLPDLIDKPLSWGLGVFPSGYALGHSIFFAIPIGILVIGIGVRTERPRLAAAFIVGHWSHIISDVLTPLRYGSSPAPGRALWPVVSATPYEADLGLGRGVTYLTDFISALGSMELTTLVVLYLTLPILTILLWILDGVPGLAVVLRTLRSRIKKPTESGE